MRFFATVNQMLGGSSQLPATAKRAVIYSLSIVQTTKQCSEAVGSWEETPNTWLTVAKNAFVGWTLNFRVRMLLKGPVKGVSKKPELKHESHVLQVFEILRVHVCRRHGRVGCGRFSSTVLQQRTIIVSFPLNCYVWSLSETEKRVLCIWCKWYRYRCTVVFFSSENPRGKGSFEKSFYFCILNRYA